jgi:hypothetical protein
MPPVHFCFSYFSGRVVCFAWSWSRAKTLLLAMSPVYTMPGLFVEMGVSLTFVQSGLDNPYLYFLSSWDYKSVQPWLATTSDFLTGFVHYSMVEGCYTMLFLMKPIFTNMAKPKFTFTII